MLLAFIADQDKLSAACAFGVVHVLRKKESDRMHMKDKHPMPLGVLCDVERKICLWDRRLWYE